MRFKEVVCFAILTMAGPVFGEECDPARTLKVDPIELVAGREVPGKVELFVDHARYRYLFASEANRAAFKNSPERFEIQLGGACARMGPLSGAGSVERYSVHKERIYIFASDACRKTFLSMPDDLLDAPDPPPPTDAQSTSRGRELIELALKGLGGASVVDALTSYRAESVTTTKERGKDYTNRKAWIVRFPNEFRSEDDWNESKWAAVAAKDAAFFDSKEVWSMHSQQRAALEAEFHRMPLVILRSRSQPDFVATASGEGTVGDKPVDFVTVAFAGTTTKLGIDRQSGRILSATYRGRGPKLAFGDLHLTFSEFTNVGGVDLPMVTTAVFNGEPATSLDRRYSKVTINEPLDATLFIRPIG